MFLRSIQINDALSFSQLRLDLRQLNLLIGPNGVGKSNLIECIRVLRLLASKETWREGLGYTFRQFVRYSSSEEREVRLKFDLTIPPFVFDFKQKAGDLEYHVSFLDKEAGKISNEDLADTENEKPVGDSVRSLRYLRRYGGGQPQLRATHDPLKSEFADEWERLEIPEYQSPLFAARGQVKFPAVTKIAEMARQMRFYDEFPTYRIFRERTWSRQLADEPSAFLNEDGSNLFAVLSAMGQAGSLGKVEESLRRFYPQFERLWVGVAQGGELRLDFFEKGLANPIPLNRVSNGTLRFLCLLAVLCHHNPPPLICLEEPETGLHPDGVRILAELVEDAAEHTQLVVATHSRQLVDAFSNRPEDVVVFEKPFGNDSEARRLNREELDRWLKDYSLGALWESGQIGGNVW
jgi:predicted ATPase